MERKTLKDIAYRLAVEEIAKPRTNKVYHGTKVKGGYLQYDPKYAYTGEGANMYGVSHYTINNPEVAKHYANLGPTPGTVLTEYIPDEKYFINPDLSFYNQSPEVQEALKKAGYEVIPKEGITFEEFIKSKGGYSIDKHSELMDLWSKTLEKTYYGELPRQNIPAAANYLDNYREMLEWAKKANLPGIVRYKPVVEGQDPVKVFQILNPFDAEIRNPLEPVQRNYTTTDKIKPIADRIMRGFDKAAAFQQAILNRPVVQGVLNHPATKALGKAANTIMNATNVVGDAMLVGDFINRTSQWHPDNIQWNRSGNPIPTRGVGMVIPASQQQPWEASPTRLYGGVQYYD